MLFKLYEYKRVGSVLLYQCSILLQESRGQTLKAVSELKLPHAELPSRCHAEVNHKLRRCLLRSGGLVALRLVYG